MTEEEPREKEKEKRLERVPAAQRLSWPLDQAALVAGIPYKALNAAADRGELRTFTLPGSRSRRVRRRDLEDWVDLLAVPRAERR